MVALIITSFNLFNALSWATTGVISAGISIAIFTKNPKKRLNQLFALGFFLWSLSMLFNGLVFVIAYHSITAANVLRSFCTVCAGFSAVILFLTAYGLYFGPGSLNKIALTIFGVLTLAFSLVGAFNDWVAEDGLGGYKTTDNALGKVCVQVIPLLFTVASIVLLVLTLRTLESGLARKRIGLYILGYLMSIIGVLVFVVDSFIDINQMILPAISQAIWVAGPVIMLISFYLKTDVEQQELLLSEEETIIHVEAVDAQKSEQNPS